MGIVRENAWVKFSAESLLEGREMVLWGKGGKGRREGLMENVWELKRDEEVLLKRVR